MGKVIVGKKCSCNGKCGDQCRCKVQKNVERKQDMADQIIIDETE